MTPGSSEAAGTPGPTGPVIRVAGRDLIRVSGVGELAEVVGAAGAAGRQITTVGSGHSFTPTALSG